jgi:hypothetical protein
VNANVIVNPNVIVNLNRSRPWAPAGLVAAVLVNDRFQPRASGFWPLALMDESAHLATTLTLLGGLAALRGRRPAPAFVLGSVLAGNLIDLDHVPKILGRPFLTNGTARPYPHSLLTVAAAAALGATGRGRTAGFLSGVALGVGGHLLRDVSISPAPLAWPFSSRDVRTPRWPYLATLTACAVSAACAAAPPLLRLPDSGRHQRAIRWPGTQPV